MPLPELHPTTFSVLLAHPYIHYPGMSLQSPDQLNLDLGGPYDHLGQSS